MAAFFMHNLGSLKVNNINMLTKLSSFYCFVLPLHFVIINKLIELYINSHKKKVQETSF